MATYFHSPNGQREAIPMIYTRESWPDSNPEHSPAISTSMMVYMNYLSSNSNEMPPPQPELLSSFPGPPRVGEENDFSVWGNGRSEMPFMPPMGSATSLLQGVQNLQRQAQGQGLSLSLSTQIPRTIQIPSIDFQNPNLNGFSSFPGPDNSPSNSLRNGDSSPNKQMRSGEYSMHPGFISDNSSNYGVPSVGRTVPNSKYLKAAQQLLDEVVNVKKAFKKQDSKKELAKSGEGTEGESRSENKFPPSSEASSNARDFSSSSPNELSAAEKQDLQNKLSKLLTMLDEVDKRYKQYYHQMQIVVSSFDVIAGSGAAKPYTALALQTISCQFRCLRDAISNQIRAVRNSLGEHDSSENGNGLRIYRLRYVDQHLKQQRAIQQLGMMQQHAWRPQRGLPERSVSILRAWLFEHFLHPYPKDSEKLMLARQTSLTKNQVSNWFINARVRLWKPMVEEMYKEEAGDAEMDSTSPETGNKASEGDYKASDGIENQELQQNANSSELYKKGHALESYRGLTSNMEMLGTTNPATQSVTDQRDELRPCMDDGGLFQGYQIPGFGRFESPSVVSLTLGLQHCEGGGSLPISVDNQNFAIYNAESSSMETQTPAFDLDPENRQHRYGSAHILRDFVA